jgi:hypothetical protein
MQMQDLRKAILAKKYPMQCLRCMGALAVYGA